jgi:hypothetical protein
VVIKGKFSVIFPFFLLAFQMQVNEGCRFFLNRNWKVQKLLAFFHFLLSHSSVVIVVLQNIAEDVLPKTLNSSGDK